ncbi:MAG: hypothetical protein J5781_04555 [Clostridia bacterium]|nr:hypothetical protein [Clostridia bacterium]
MKKFKTAVGLIIIIVLILAALLSQLHFVAEVDHDCSGEDCPVCRLMLFSERIFKSFFFAAASVALLCFILQFKQKKDIIKRFFNDIITLITLRVKLSA